MIVFRRDPVLKGSICKNELSGKIDVVGSLGWQRTFSSVTDTDIYQIQWYIEKNYGLKNDRIINKALNIVASENRYHPIRDCLEKLEWDGQRRIDDLLPRYLGADCDDYTKEIITLLKDPQYTETIILQQDVDRFDVKIVWVKGPEDCKKVLDLNGHTMTCPHIVNYANLYLTDSAGGGALILTEGSLTNSATLTIDGANVVCTTAIDNRRGKRFRLVSGSVMSESRCAIMNEGGICTVDGGTICGRSIAICSYPGVELYPAYGYDENGKIIAGTTGTHFHDATLVINGGELSGDVEVSNTDVTITGGTIHGSIKGEKYNGDEVKSIEYHNASGELITLPLPTYELHEENGEMKRGYWDVSMDDWFYAPVQRLMDDGVLDYGKDGNFEPSEPLTRGQAAALLVRACGVETQEEWQEPVFFDVAETTPYAKYINAGKNAGLLSGNGQGQFHPEDTVTRQEFAVLVMNAVDGNYLVLPAETRPFTVSDEAAIAAWAKDAVMEGAAHGLWQGVGNGNFAPQNTISRAEAATMVARLLR